MAFIILILLCLSSVYGIMTKPYVCTLVAKNDTVHMMANTSYTCSLFSLVHGGSPPFVFSYEIRINGAIYSGATTVGPYFFTPPEGYTGKAVLSYRVGDSSNHHCTRTATVIIIVR